MNRAEAVDWQLRKAMETRDKAARALNEAMARVRHLEQTRDYVQSDTRVGSDPTELVSCSHCGADVSTERLFTQHFVIPDPRYYNLGSCPNRKSS